MMERMGSGVEEEEEAPGERGKEKTSSPGLLRGRAPRWHSIYAQKEASMDELWRGCGRGVGMRASAEPPLRASRGGTPPPPLRHCALCFKKTWRPSVQPSRTSSLLFLFKLNPGGLSHGPPSLSTPFQGLLHGL